MHDQLVKRLHDTGTAFKAVQGFARVQGINPASAATLVPLARDIGAVTGEDMAGVATKIAQVFAQSTDAAIKLTQALGGPNALSAAEIKSMQTMAAHGDRAGALRVAIAQQVAAALPQIAAAEHLAEATKQGAAAAHEAALQNQAAVATQDAPARAEATRNPLLIAQAKALNDAALAEEKRHDAAEATRQVYAAINQRNDQLAVTQLATSMQGQTPEAIAAATAHLQEQQKLLNSGLDLSSDIAKASLDNVDALAAANTQWAEAVRQQQRAEDGARRAKSADGSLISSITSSLFLRPLTSQPLLPLGWGNFGENDRIRCRSDRCQCALLCRDSLAYAVAGEHVPLGI